MFVFLCTGIGYQIAFPILLSPLFHTTLKKSPSQKNGETMSLNPSSDSPNTRRYALRAAIVHNCGSGSNSSGPPPLNYSHAYVKGADSRWWLCGDDKVTEAIVPMIQKQAQHLLFYLLEPPPQASTGKDKASTGKRLREKSKRLLDAGFYDRLLGHGCPPLPPCMAEILLHASTGTMHVMACRMVPRGTGT